MKEQNIKKGVLYGLGAYLLWGFLPIYWKLLESASAEVVLAHRIIWSFVFMILFITITKRLKSFIKECKRILRHKRTILIISAASLIISANWLIFIWAVQAGYVIQTSLGYYINPLMSVLLGVLFLKEKLSPAQIISFLLAGIGVVYLTISYGVFPWISLSLAITFAVYGLLKKIVHLSSTFSLAIETLIVTPVALIYLLSMYGVNLGFVNGSAGTNGLLMISGIATAVPLLLFGSSVQFIPLSMVGFLQYIAPTIMLFIGVFLFGEEFTSAHLFTFSLIWISLILYMSTSIQKREKTNIKQEKSKSSL
ncbi:EamA family transporter RarD [Pseudogracilibacillus sp. SE30717A]|uniref:EamA family transporter RarD n=1 Tax=Pseudogracilibacillus sp. SE30717A TaxID=3098293 RepID=UPI00300DF45B